VLGASGTYPTAGQACSGYLLQAAGLRVWVDAGAGTLANLMHHITPPELDAIWVSHLHADHASDLALAGHALCFGHEPARSPIPVLGPPGLREYVHALLPAGVPGVPEQAFDLHEVHDGERFELDGLTLESVAVEHAMPAFGLRVTIAPASPGAGPVVFAYSGDTGPAASLTRLAADADLFLCEASWTAQPDGVPPIHLTAEQAGHCAAAAGARRLVLTHLRPDSDPAAAAEAAARTFGGPVEIATQGAELAFGI
jgi:ribonuclease BN (tRNA processing enzyme)